MLDFVNKILSSIFGNKAATDMKTLLPLVDKVKAAEQTISALDNDGLRSMTMDFRKRISEHIQETSEEITSLNASIESDPDMPITQKEDIYRKIDELKKEENRKIEEMLMEILPEAFAVVRETGRRLTASSEIKVL
ncbi:MAG: preprotein translocase subunit SecA, partial [Bacteroidota bacterium]